jgi:hypothetical protein
MPTLFVNGAQVEIHHPQIEDLKQQLQEMEVNGHMTLEGWDSKGHFWVYIPYGAPVLIRS